MFHKVIRSLLAQDQFKDLTVYSICTDRHDPPRHLYLYESANHRVPLPAGKCGVYTELTWDSEIPMDEDYITAMLVVALISIKDHIRTLNNGTRDR